MPFDYPSDHLFDAVGMAWFLGLFFGLPMLGWVAMALDVRAYYRGLRRALVVLHKYTLETPLWALRDRPACLDELGLSADCTREQVMAAYRKRVMQVHPDRGGDRRRFDVLQARFREAIQLVESRESC